MIPEARSKNGIAHRVFLAPPSRHVLDVRRAAAVPSRFVFPTTRDGSSPLRFETRKRLRQAVGFDFNPHDLRRTASTHLARLGVRDEIREAILNHKKTGLRGVYNLYEYDREKQAALMLWAQTVTALADDGPRAEADQPA